MLAENYCPAGNTDDNKVLSGIFAWLCWAIPLLVTEALLQVRKIQKQSIGSKPTTNNVLVKERLTIIAPTESTNQPPRYMKPREYECRSCAKRKPLAALTNRPFVTKKENT